MEVLETNASTMFALEKARCEICLAAFPLKVKILGEEFKLIEFPQEGPHLILETVELGERKNRNVYILKLS